MLAAPVRMPEPETGQSATAVALLPFPEGGALPAGFPPGAEPNTATVVEAPKAQCDADGIVEEPTLRLAPVTPEVSVASAVDGKRCGWCETKNRLDAERCVRCNAMFPRPEQDEAIRRAGEARIQAGEDEIELRKRVRKWGGLGRLFGS